MFYDALRTPNTDSVPYTTLPLILCLHDFEVPAEPGLIRGTRVNTLRPASDLIGVFPALIHFLGAARRRDEQFGPWRVGGRHDEVHAIGASAYVWDHGNFEGRGERG